MAKVHTPAAVVPKKKAFKKLITQKLEDALGDLKLALGEKKFHQRLKKAVKIFSEDFTAIVSETSPDSTIKSDALPPVAKKKLATKKKAIKKVAVKKVKKNSTSGNV